MKCVTDVFRKMIKDDEPAAIRYLIENQPNPEFTWSMIAWAQRYIQCGHKCTAGYSLIGPRKQKNSKTGMWMTVDPRAKIGTMSGHLMYRFKLDDKPYYGWDQPTESGTWNMADFSHAAIWLMERPYHLMREERWHFNSLYLHCQNMCVLDIDSYKGKTPSSIYKFIMDTISAESPTCPIAISQRGGIHALFRPEDNIKGKPKLGIDLKSRHAFIYGPPTQIHRGGAYQWQNIRCASEFPEKLPRMPVDLLDFFTPPKSNRTYTDTRPEHRETFSGKQMEVLERLLIEAEDANDRSGGDFAAAMWAYKIGMDIDQFAEYAMERSKFRDRGCEYLERTWENVMNSYCENS